MVTNGNGEMEMKASRYSPRFLLRLIYLIVGSLAHAADLQFSPFQLPAETTGRVLQDFLNDFLQASIISAGCYGKGEGGG